MLADALVEASWETPDILIDCATLTGTYRMPAAGVISSRCWLYRACGATVRFGVLVVPAT